MLPSQAREYTQCLWEEFLLGKVRRVLTKEPEGGMASCILVLSGCFLVIVAASLRTGVYAPWLTLVLGIILILLGLAEGVPLRRRRLALELRLVAYSIWVFGLISLGVLGVFRVLH